MDKASMDTSNGEATDSAASPEADADLILGHTPAEGTTIKGNTRPWASAIKALRHGFKWWREGGCWYRYQSKGTPTPTLDMESAAAALRRAGATVRVVVETGDAGEAAAIRREHFEERAAHFAETGNTARAEALQRKADGLAPERIAARAEVQSWVDELSELLSAKLKTDLPGIHTLRKTAKSTGSRAWSIYWLRGTGSDGKELTVQLHLDSRGLELERHRLCSPTDDAAAAYAKTVERMRPLFAEKAKVDRRKSLADAFGRGFRRAVSFRFSIERGESWRHKADGSGEELIYFFVRTPRGTAIVHAFDTRLVLQWNKGGLSREEKREEWAADTRADKAIVELATKQLASWYEAAAPAAPEAQS